MKILKSFGVITLAVIIGFALIACGESGNGNGQQGNGQQGNGQQGNGGGTPLFSVSGEFSGATGTPVQFKAETEQTAARSARSVGAATYEMTGELEDGDFLLRLNGTFNPQDNSYTLSAAASVLRYTINGSPTGATTTIAVYDVTEQEWKSFIVSVTLRDTVTITEGEPEEYEGGIPSWAWGTDLYSEGVWDGSNWGETYATISQWFVVINHSGGWNGNITNGVETRYTVLESERISDTEYSFILTYPVYEATKEQLQTAGKAFLEENGFRAIFWDKDTSSYESPYLDSTINTYEADHWNNSIWNFNNVYYSYDDETNNIIFHNGWDRNRIIFERWSRDDFLNKYLVKHYTEDQLNSTTWYTKMNFSQAWGGRLLIQRYDGDREDSGKPGSDTTSFDKIKAITEANLYPGPNYDYNIHFHNQTRTTPKPFTMYAVQGDPVWGPGWVSSLGNYDEGYRQNWNFNVSGIELLQIGFDGDVNYNNWSKMVIELKDDVTEIHQIRIGLASQHRDNEGRWIAYAGGRNFSYDYYTVDNTNRTITLRYKDAIRDGQSGVWGNTDENTGIEYQFDLTRVSGFDITYGYGTTFYDTNVDATYVNIMPLVRRIWLEL